MNLLIGSRALNFWFPSVPISENTDWDIISDKPIEGCEWHDPDILNNRKVTQYASNHVVCLPEGKTANIVTPLGLALIKRSHLHRSLSFQKHITHYHRYLHRQICKYAYTEDFQFLEERIKLTKEQFHRGNPNLMQSKEDFFNDAVVKKYDHDYLHELFAYYDKPLYTKLLRQEGVAWCEKDKWDLLSHQDKLKCMAEEVQVIAAERFMIPKNWDYPSKLAYMKALEKVCTTLCSGWFRDYAIDHYPEALEMYNKKKFEQVKLILEKE